MTEYLAMFWAFVKVGFTSFGGLSMIPLINAEMVSHGWMTSAEVADIVAIAEMTPGPLGFNCATFAGMKTLGIAGALVANLGVMSPSLTLCAVAAAFFERFKNSRRMKQMMAGVRPGMVGMVAGVVVSLAATTYFAGTAENGLPLWSTLSVPSVLISILDVYLLRKRKWSVPRTIILSAAIGFLCFYLLQAIR